MKMEKLQQILRNKKMSPTIENLTTELIRLPKTERLEIVRFLLFLDSYSLKRAEKTHNSDAVWDNEIAERVKSVDDGSAIGLDFDEVMQNIERRFA
jgi:hypothetical protein